MKAVILAVDPALSAGWAIRDRNGLGASGVVDFHRRALDVPGHLWQMIREWLASRIADHAPTHIVLEAPGGVRGLATVRIAYGWLALSQLAAADHALRWSSIHPSTLKKWATGRGDAKKPAMLAAARARWPERHLWNEDEVDACLLAERAWEILLAPVPF